MGWASGSVLASEMIDVIKREVKDKKVRRKIYDMLIGVFEDQDCDTLDECRGTDKAFDEAMDNIYGEPAE